MIYILLIDILRIIFCPYPVAKILYDSKWFCLIPPLNLGQLRRILFFRIGFYPILLLFLTNPGDILHFYMFFWTLCSSNPWNLDSQQASQQWIKVRTSLLSNRSTNLLKSNLDMSLAFFSKILLMITSLSNSAWTVITPFYSLTSLTKSELTYFSPTTLFGAIPKKPFSSSNRTSSRSTYTFLVSLILLFPFS